MNTFQIPPHLAGLAALGLFACSAPSDSAEDDSTLGTSRQALACDEGPVPAMTGLQTPSGRISRSGALDRQYEAFNAFDREPSLWISAAFQTPAWIQYQWADGPRTITHYAIRYANGAITTRAPKDWSLLGYAGGSWVEVDARQNQTEWDGVERRHFAVTSPGAYSAYRLSISDDNDTRAGVVVVSIDELELFDCGSAPPDPVECQRFTEPSDGVCSRADDDPCRLQDPDCEARGCGGRLGATCSPAEYCGYGVGEYCGAADASSTCQLRPDVCERGGSPVCGCDRRTYASSCAAAQAGFGVLSLGACQ